MRSRPWLRDAPAFTESEASALAMRLYGLEAEATKLPSERDQNFLLRAVDGTRSVLKVANALEERSLLEAQNRALARVSTRTGLCPQPLPDRTGGLIAETGSGDGPRHLVRRLTWLDGEALGATAGRPAGLLHGLGRAVGRLDAALAGLDDAAFHRDLPWDLARGPDVIGEHAPLIAEAATRSLVTDIAADFRARVAPRSSRLRRSVIHNDANDHNVIVEVGAGAFPLARGVAGFIDFGDMLWGWTVGDLAIAVAYAVLDAADPLAAAAHVVGGYHEANPLEDDEIAAVLPLVRLRLATSLCMAAWQAEQRPGDPYLTISQAPIRRLLPRLAAVHPRIAEAVFRAACGLEPVPATARVRAWLESRAPFPPVLGGRDPARTPHVVLDLSVGSPLMRGDPSANDEPALTPRLRERMAAAGAGVGIGRYDEARLINTGEAYAGGRFADERRTVHLGIDLFVDAGSPVHTPIAGRVAAFSNNAAPQDYGPVIVLEHSADGQPFHTLWGHLAATSLVGLEVGRDFAQGERIGTVGTAAENGGWTPHLHLQLVTDLLGLGCAFPGVCRASERVAWKALSPDPDLVLNLPALADTPPAPNRAESLAARRALLGPNLGLSYTEPVRLARGWMQYVFDESGRRYVDAYNNVPHVGHAHPRVVRAASEQMAILNTNTRYLNDLLGRFAERLARTLPQPLRVCWFLNSASEANELALRLARAHTRQRDTIVLEAAYHGHTTTLIDISPYKHAGPGGQGAPPWVHAAPLPDVYRGPHRSDDPRAGQKYAAHVGAIIDRLAARGRGVAAFIAESCPSVAGQIVLPAGYLQAAYAHVHDAGGVCIADEVQTGYGRIGTHFYAFEAQDVVPDIVVLGKPIGNGHPIGAVVTTPAIAASFDTGMEFFSTFGGNTVSCAVGLAVLDVLEEEGLQDHALRVGRHLLGRLRPLADRFPIIGDVRGSGLFLGVELVRDRASLEPAGDEAAHICDRMRERGVLIGTDGPFHNVLKIRPPMPFTDADADGLVSTLVEVLDTLPVGRGSGS